MLKPKTKTGLAQKTVKGRAESLDRPAEVVAAAVPMPIMVECPAGVDPEGPREYTDGRRVFRPWPVRIRIGRSDKPERAKGRMDAVVRVYERVPPHHGLPAKLRLVTPEELAERAAPACAAPVAALGGA